MESVHSISSIDVAELLDTGRWSRYQKLLTALVAIAVVFDGFDIQILGFAIPSLIREWHAARAEFGMVLAAGLAGMVMGALIAGYAGDRFGRRPAVIGCVVMFGLSTLATLSSVASSGSPSCASLRELRQVGCFQMSVLSVPSLLHCGVDLQR